MRRNKNRKPETKKPEKAQEDTPLHRQSPLIGAAEIGSPSPPSSLSPKTTMTKTNKSSSSTITANTTTTSTSACAACKYQRRRCAPDCILAPHFPANNPHQFLNVHRLFGVSNVLKILKNMEPRLHKQAMSSIIFHSNMRARDPVLGCYRLINELKRQIDHYCEALQLVRNQIDLYKPQKNDATTDVSSCCDANYTQAATSVDDYGNMPIMQQQQLQQQQHQPQQQYYNSLLYDLQENQDSNHNVMAGDNDNNDLSNGLGFNFNLDNLGNESLEMEMIGERQEETMKPSGDMFDMENAFEYGDNSKDLTVASSFIALDGCPNNVLTDGGCPTKEMQEHELQLATTFFL